MIKTSVKKEKTLLDSHLIRVWCHVSVLFQLHHSPGCFFFVSWNSVKINRSGVYSQSWRLIFSKVWLWKFGATSSKTPLLIFSFPLITLLLEVEMIMSGEITYWSLPGVKGVISYIVDNIVRKYLFHRNDQNLSQVDQLSNRSSDDKINAELP